MTEQIEWLRDENECYYATEYLKRRANDLEWSCIKNTGIQLTEKANVRRTAEAWVNALQKNQCSKIITRLQNNLRQRRSQKKNKEKRFNLSLEACRALDELTRKFGKSPSETVSILLINTPEALAEAREKWMFEHKKQIEQWTYEHLGLQHQLKIKNLEVDELHKQLRSHILALEMWKTSMDSDAPPFDGEIEELDEQVNEKLRIIQRDVKKQTKVLSSIPG
ncbi:MAG: hypothetical protein ACKVK5_15265 [Pseudomonadales bacterium]